jgi:hypothetical protein
MTYRIDGGIPENTQGLSGVGIAAGGGLMGIPVRYSK